MDRELLKRYLDEGLSLPQIGLLTNRDPSTVGYWVEKHGLVANGKAKYAPRGGLTREQLEPLVEDGVTLEEMAAELDRSVSTIRHWLKRHGLKTRNRRGRRPAVDHRALDAKVAAGDRTVRAVCHRHGETEFAIAGARRRLQCKLCRAEAVARRRRKVKETLVEEAGGRCLLCGYDRYVGALQFHHVDRKTKSFGIAQKGVTRGIDKLREEAEKCVLLCSNCHAEVEAGVTGLDLQ
jgi:hypothetical protein